MSNCLNTQASNIDSSDVLVSEALDHISAHWRPQLINTASELKIYDFLSKEPMSTDELAKATGTHSETLFRFMRALANINVFKLDHNQKWTTTPLATVIFTKLKNYASSWLDSYSLLSTLTDVVKTGRNHFEEHYGLPCYEWYKSKPKQLQTFNNAMSEIGNVIGSKLTEIYDFSQFKYIVDVGGGRGVFMSEMLKSAPNVTGIVFDQPHVVQAAQDNNEEIKEVRDRITFIGGNFMDNVPSGGDCYTIRNVLNDYSDNIALQILKNIANEMNGKSKLLIIESKPNTRFGSLFDLLLLSNLNGVLRGEDGFQKLLPKAGLQINKCIKSVGDNMDIIEVFKIE